ncbi:MAG: hypothetical protein IJ408_04260 [Clostridia bacterium]|nr:hypothetical protein [Clostridia bacterium]
MTKPKDVYENFHVIPANKKISLEKARELYVSNRVSDIVYPPHSYVIPQYLKYAHTLEEGEVYDCYIFETDENEGLDFYVFMTKMVDYYDSVADPVLIQTVFVDKSAVYEYEIGDNIAKVAEDHPNLQLLKNNVIVDIGSRYFELLSGNYIYSYTVDENGKIVTKQIADLIEIQNNYTPKE